MLISVVDRHQLNGKPDPDPNFYFDADQDPDPYPDRHLNDAEPHADPIPSLTYVGKFGKNSLLFTSTPVYNVFLFSSKVNVL